MQTNKIVIRNVNSALLTVCYKLSIIYHRYRLRFGLCSFYQVLQFFILLMLNESSTTNQKQAIVFLPYLTPKDDYDKITLIVQRYNKEWLLKFAKY